MAMISDDAFKTSCRALHDYASFRHKSPNHDAKLVLKVEQQGDETVLRATSVTSMSLLDKIIHFLGFGSFQLRHVVNFIESQSFRDKLNITSLSEEERRHLHAALFSLDRTIKKYNAHHCCFSVETQEPLAKMFQTLLSLTPISADKLPQYVLNPICQEGSELFAFEEALNRGIVSGAVRVTKEGKIIGLANIARLPAKASATLKAQYSQIKNRAFVFQQIRNLQALTAPTYGEQFLKILCEERGIALPSSVHFAAAQANVLKQLLDADSSLGTLQSEKFSSIADIVTNCKRVAMLGACDLPLEETTSYLTAWQQSETVKNQLSKARSHVLDIIKEDIHSLFLPPLLRDRLLATAKRVTNSTLETAIEAIYNTTIRQFAKGSLSLQAYTQEMTGTTREIDFAQTALADLRQNPDWIARLAFHKKWHSYAVQEMAQGFYDQGETFGRGICYAIALRWTIEEIKGFESLSKEELFNKLAVGKTFAKDRYTQIFYQKVRDKAKLFKMVGIKKATSEYLNDDILPEKEAVQKALKTVGKRLSANKQYKGAAELGFWWYEESDKQTVGHAISVVCHENKHKPELSCFRFHDPNFGSYSFSSAQELFDCLSDLLTMIYCPEIKHIQATYFEL